MPDRAADPDSRPRAPGETRRRKGGGRPSTNKQLTIARNDRLVLERLAASERPLGAYEILKQVADEGIIAPNSVYRALRKLIALGKVRKIAGISAYAALRTVAQGEVVAYVICRRCRRAVEKTLAHRDIAPLIADPSLPVDSVFIEAFGECAGGDCTPQPSRRNGKRPA